MVDQAIVEGFTGFVDGTQRWILGYSETVEDDQEGACHRYMLSQAVDELGKAGLLVGGVVTVNDTLLCHAVEVTYSSA